MQKRITSFLLLLALIFAVLPPGAKAASVVAEGNCGKSLTWKLDDEGVFTISGTGAMDTPVYSFDRSWYDYVSQIKTVIVEPGVTTLGAYAFDECYNLVEASLPEGLTGIGKFAFDECSVLQKVNIPKSVKEIGVCAFYACRELKSITFPEGMTEIAASICNGCYALESISLDDGIIIIADSAFQDCQSLKSVTLPLQLKTMGTTVFEGCAALKSVVLPPRLQELGSQSFRRCHALEKVVFTGPAPVIDEYAFYETTTDVYYPAYQTTWNADTQLDYGGTLTWIADSTITRLAGTDRADTAVKIAANGFGGADNVVIASKDSFADALAGVPLAYALCAPILLAGQSIDKGTLDEIKAMGAKKAYILGGNAAVGQNTEAALLSGGLSVERIAGVNRYETAVKIADCLAEISGTTSEEVFFASGENYPDALSASVVAALKGAPILYISRSGSPEKAGDYLMENGVSSAVILGGASAVPSNAEETLSQYGISSAKRYAGSSRYDTNFKIIKAYADLFTGNALCVATGKNYPDALAGGAYAALARAPILLVDNRLYSGQVAYVRSLKEAEVVVFGGAAGVDNTVLGELICAVCK